MKRIALILMTGFVVTSIASMIRTHVARDTSFVVEAATAGGSEGTIEAGIVINATSLDNLKEQIMDFCPEIREEIQNATMMHQGVPLTSDRFEEFDARNSVSFRLTAVTLRVYYLGMPIVKLNAVSLKDLMRQVVQLKLPSVKALMIDGQSLTPQVFATLKDGDCVDIIDK